MPRAALSHSIVISGEPRSIMAAPSRNVRPDRCRLAADGGRTTGAAGAMPGLFHWDYLLSLIDLMASGGMPDFSEIALSCSSMASRMALSLSYGSLATAA